MTFTELPVTGAFVIDIQRITDDRGFFSRGWCRREFETQGLATEFVQMNIGFSPRKGTLRGMHYQSSPHAEVKLVRCTLGAVCDVIIDLRRWSSTFKMWHAVELSAENHRMIYVPEGFAHGYLTLVDDTEIYYHTTNFYSPESARGVRFNDPAFAIEWPAMPTVISDRDNSYPDFMTQ
jgi:dTDP-4-dehydrorhamnose 3,5-epimerase